MRKVKKWPQTSKDLHAHYNDRGLLLNHIHYDMELNTNVIILDIFN